MSKIIQVGNSLAVTIPSKFIKQTGLKLGDEINIKTIATKGKLVIHFKNMRQLPLIQ